METIKKVRLAARRDGKPIKQIARELRLSKNTVRKILIGKDRDFNERFEQLCSHYLFEPVVN